MAKLLISVKSVDEALLALAAGVDVIDFKDPSNGALGALDCALSAQIVQAIKQQNKLVNPQAHKTMQISATVGEHHTALNALMADTKARIEICIDIIKIAVSPLFYTPDFLIEIRKLTLNNAKIMAVFFADEIIDFNVLPILANAGFDGAMLDTKNKQQNLISVQSKTALQQFSQKCHQYDLKSGFAGSLKPQYMDYLVEFNPTYIGFRGGVCENSIRNAPLSRAKLIEVVTMLHKHNNTHCKVHKSLYPALHS